MKVAQFFFGYPMFRKICGENFLDGPKPNINFCVLFMRRARLPLILRTQNQSKSHQNPILTLYNTQMPACINKHCTLLTSNCSENKIPKYLLVLQNTDGYRTE